MSRVTPPEQCPQCNWTNHGIRNYGQPDAPRWACHGCASRLIGSIGVIEHLTVEAIAAWVRRFAGKREAKWLADQISAGAWRKP
jgi:hypothetical protein